MNVWGAYPPLSSASNYLKQFSRQYIFPYATRNWNDSSSKKRERAVFAQSIIDSV